MRQKPSDAPAPPPKLDPLAEAVAFFGRMLEMARSAAENIAARSKTDPEHHSPAAQSFFEGQAKAYETVIARLETITGKGRK